MLIDVSEAGYASPMKPSASHSPLTRCEGRPAVIPPGRCERLICTIIHGATGALPNKNNYARKRSTKFHYWRAFKLPVRSRLATSYLHSN